MKYNRLGKTTISLSTVGFGTVQLRMVPEQQAVDALKKAFELGINWVQIAPEYGGCERIVAQAIRESHRDVMVLNLVSGTAADFAQTFDATCRLVGKNRLEMFGISCIDDAEYLDLNVWGPGGMVEFLKEKKAQGRLGALVCSTHSSPDFVANLIQKNVFDGIMLAYNPLGFHLNSYFEASEGRVHEDLKKNREDIFPLAKENGTGLLIMKALAGGLLCQGKAIGPREWLPGPEHPLTAPDILESILSCPGVCAVIPGMASVEEVVENAKAGDAPAARGNIDTLERKASCFTGLLCSKCGACESSCSQGLRISMLFRDAYFWIYRTKTAETIDRLHYFVLHPKEELACHSCTDKTCSCPNGLNIPEQLEAVHHWMVKLRKNKILPPPPQQHLQERVDGKFPALVLSREAPGQVAVGETFICRFWLQNAGDRKWTVSEPGDRAVAMGIFSRNTLMSKVGLREDVYPGMRTHFTVRVDAFKRPGRQDLEFFLVPALGEPSKKNGTKIFNTSIKVKGSLHLPRMALSPALGLAKRIVRRLIPRSPAKLILNSNLFDSAYYLRTNRELDLEEDEALTHFIAQGWKENRNPHPLFDTAWYLNKYPDVADAGVNPLVHFVANGGAELRDPNPMFSTAYYLKTAPEAAGENPLSHYVQQGWKQGRDPHPGFSTKAYLARFPRLAARGLNPLAHYLENLPRCGLAYISHNIPSHLPAATVFPAKLVLKNTGTRTWNRNGENGNDTMLMVSWDGTHTANHPLTKSQVSPGEETFLVFPLAVPRDLGHHTLRLELLELKTGKFQEHGVEPLDIQLEAGESPSCPNLETHLLARKINPWYYQPTQGISRGADGSRYPLFVSRARGCHSWDLEDRKYIDYLMGYGCVPLGYNDPRIRAAITGVLDINMISPFPHPLEMEVSKMITEDLPSGEMVLFGKNGSDVCTVAARMSRLYTGKRQILCCGYQGWQDFWVEQFGFGQTGVPDRPDCLIHPFKFNDPEDFLKLYDTHKKDLAAVMLEPSGPWGGEFSGHEPDIAPEFLSLLRDATRQAGAVLVYDEIVTGFRYPRGSVQKKTGILPDLTCLGKAMASGMPLSALAGRAEIFQRCMRNAWYCPTFKGEILSFAAAKAAMEIYRREPVAQHIWEYGLKLKSGIQKICDDLDLDAGCQGPPFRMALTFKEPDIDRHRMKRTLLHQELLKNGIITLNGVMLPSVAHTDDILDQTFNIIGTALEVVATAQNRNAFDRYIEIPVF